MALKPCWNDGQHLSRAASTFKPSLRHTAACCLHYGSSLCIHSATLEQESTTALELEHHCVLERILAEPDDWLPRDDCKMGRRGKRENAQSDKMESRQITSYGTEQPKDPQQLPVTERELRLI